MLRMLRMFLFMVALLGSTFSAVAQSSGVVVTVNAGLQHAAEANVTGLPATLPSSFVVSRAATAVGTLQIDSDVTVAGPGCTVNCALQTVRAVGQQVLSAGASFSGGAGLGPLRAEGATNSAFNLVIDISPPAATRSGARPPGR